jgi:hypothetical protein
MDHDKLRQLAANAAACRECLSAVKNRDGLAPLVVIAPRNGSLNRMEFGLDSVFGHAGDIVAVIEQQLSSQLERYENQIKELVNNQEAEDY